MIWTRHGLDALDLSATWRHYGTWWILPWVFGVHQCSSWLTKLPCNCPIVRADKFRVPHEALHRPWWAVKRSAIRSCEEPRDQRLEWLVPSFSWDHSPLTIEQPARLPTWHYWLCKKLLNLTWSGRESARWSIWPWLFLASFTTSNP